MPFACLEVGPNQELEWEPIDLATDKPPPEHPPHQWAERERWTGWAEWDQYCRLVQQHTCLTQLCDYIVPIMNHYYDLGEEDLGSVS